MIGALITWGLCILSFLAGFILCSMFRIGRLEDAERTETVDANEMPAADDYIDWSKVPEDGKYIAMDADGRASWYREEPSFDPEDDYWHTGNDEMWDDNQWVRCSAIIGPLPPWRESLRHRPTTERTPS